jgi:hypothetical protein
MFTICGSPCLRFEIFMASKIHVVISSAEVCEDSMFLQNVGVHCVS